MRIVRVFIGYVLASVAAATTLVLFVYTPVELATSAAPAPAARLAEAALFVLVVAPYLALFAAIPALLAATLAELRGISTWGYHATVGVAIGAVGFLIQHFTEGPGQPTILHNYALTAFLSAGLVGGAVYWLVSGRFASRAGAAPRGSDRHSALGSART